jgi:serine/threonine protein kinase
MPVTVQVATLAKGTEPFPGYHLEKFIGRGAWGEVWQARQPDGTSVALKFVPCDSQLSAAQEVRALQWVRHLDHPNIIKLEQIWCYGGHIVIAMELAEGSLVDLLELYVMEYDSFIFPQHLCQYLMQAAEALDFLNARQHIINGQRVAVRHCDVKPSNLLVRAGTVKLADFSLAVQTTSTSWYHRRAGTLSYAAPEVFQGWLSDRTDQYSLAVTYCELRTGQLPFPKSPSRFSKLYTRPAPDLSLLTPGERKVLARALAPIPQDRWPTCREMMEQIAQALEPRKG